MHTHKRPFILQRHFVLKILCLALFKICECICTLKFLNEGTKVVFRNRVKLHCYHSVKGQSENFLMVLLLHMLVNFLMPVCSYSLEFNYTYMHAHIIAELTWVEK